MPALATLKSHPRFHTMLSMTDPPRAHQVHIACRSRSEISRNGHGGMGKVRRTWNPCPAVAFGILYVLRSMSLITSGGVPSHHVCRYPPSPRSSPSCKVSNFWTSIACTDILPCCGPRFGSRSWEDTMTGEIVTCSVVATPLRTLGLVQDLQCTMADQSHSCPIRSPDVGGLSVFGKQLTGGERSTPAVRVLNNNRGNP